MVRKYNLNDGEIEEYLDWNISNDDLDFPDDEDDLGELLNFYIFYASNILLLFVFIWDFIDNFESPEYNILNLPDNSVMFHIFIYKEYLFY